MSEEPPRSISYAVDETDDGGPSLTVDFPPATSPDAQLAEDIRKDIQDLRATLQRIERDVAALHREIGSVRDGFASTALTAALIERLIERFDA